MREKYGKKHIGNVSSEIGIGIRAKQFLDSLREEDPSSFPDYQREFKRRLSPENDPSGKNAGLLTAAYQLAIQEIGLNDDVISRSTALVAKSTREEISLLIGKNKTIETEISNTINALVRETIGEILGPVPEKELNEFAKQSKRQRKRQEKKRSNLRENQLSKEAIRAKILEDIRTILSNLKYKARKKNPSLIDVTNLLRSIIPRHIISIVEDGYTPEAKRSSKFS